MVGKSAIVLERGGQIVLFFIVFSVCSIFFGGNCRFNKRRKKPDIFPYHLASNERRRFIFFLSFGFCGMFWSIYIHISSCRLGFAVSVDALSVVAVYPIYHTNLEGRSQFQFYHIARLLRIYILPAITWPAQCPSFYMYRGSPNNSTERCNLGSVLLGLGFNVFLSCALLNQ